MNNGIINLIIILKERGNPVKRNNHYVLKELSGIPYLLPYGQTQADYGRGSRLNETSAFLWNLLEQEHDREELIAACAEHYGTTKKEHPSLVADIDQFLENLTARGYLKESSIAPSPKSTPGRHIRAGNLTLKLVGPQEAFSENFDLFLCDETKTADQTIVLHPYSPSRHVIGELLLRNGELTIIDAESKYVLFFPNKAQIEEIHLSKDATLANIYYYPPYTDTFREELFHAIRFVFLYLAQKHHMAVLHSASFLYQDRAWLFSAPSGTGKSTHTNLWHELLGVPLLNGDLNVLALENGEPTIHGLPWCGTSKICDTASYPLGGIILLRQAKEDYVEKLSADTKRLLVLQRLISPTWTPQMLSANLDLVDELADKIYIARLHCTKNFSAVDVMKEGIDSYLATR